MGWQGENGGGVNDELPSRRGEQKNGRKALFERKTKTELRISHTCIASLFGSTCRMS